CPTRRSSDPRISLRALPPGRAIGSRRALGALRTMAIVHRAGAVPVHVFGREVAYPVAVQVPAMLPGRPGLARSPGGPLRSRIPLRARRTRISLRALQTWRAISSRRALGALPATATVPRAGA